MDRDEGLRYVTTRGWLAKTSSDFQRAILSGCELRRFEAGAPLQVGGEEHGELIGLVEGTLSPRTTLGPDDTPIMHLAQPGLAQEVACAAGSCDEQKMAPNGVIAVGVGREPKPPQT